MCKFKSEKNRCFDRQLYITDSIYRTQSSGSQQLQKSRRFEVSSLGKRCSRGQDVSDYPWLEGDRSSVLSERQSMQQILQEQRSQFPKQEREKEAGK